MKFEDWSRLLGEKNSLKTHRPITHSVGSSITLLSECPKDISGLISSRISCFKILASGNPLVSSFLLSQIFFPSILTVKTPPGLSLFGFKETESRSFSNVVSSSWANQADLRSHLQPVQYSIDTTGFAFNSVDRAKKAGVFKTANDDASGIMISNKIASWRQI